MLETMAKVEIIGPKKLFYPTVGLLHQLGTIHLEDLSKKEQHVAVRQMTVDEATEGIKNNLENLLVRLGSIMEAIKPEAKESRADIKLESDFYKKIWHKDTLLLIEEADKLVNQLEDKARELANRKYDLEVDLTKTQRYLSIIKKIKPLAKQIVVLEGFETVAFLLEKKYKDTLEPIREEMAKLTEDQYELVSADVDDDTTAALVIFHKKYSGPVHAFLSDNVNEVRLPPEMKNRPFDEVIAEMEANEKQLPKQLTEIKSDLEKVSSDWFYKIKAMSSAVNDRIEELMHVPHFGETDYTFVVQGWVPFKNLDEVKNLISKKFGQKVLVTQLELSHHDLEEAPVVINNPKWAKPFEMILKIVQPPKYGTIDPTPMIAIFFPLLFGFIIGDMGYALVIGIAATLLKRKFKGNEAAEAICSIFQVGAVSGFLFGVLFGEFFGNMIGSHSPIHFLRVIKPIHIPINIKGLSEEGQLVLPIERTTEMLFPFLFISIGLGLIHLSVGLIMGIVNAVREKARRHAFEKGGLLGVLLGIIAAFIVFLAGGSNYIVSYILAGLGLAFTFYGAGLLNALEHFFGTMANLFSYMRLIALALSAVVLAEVANELGARFGESGGAGIIIGIAIASLLHIINIVVASFSPTIHTIRLNIIEFFNRFYEPGGKKYEPFRIRR